MSSFTERRRCTSPAGHSGRGSGEGIVVALNGTPLNGYGAAPSMLPHDAADFTAIETRRMDEKPHDGVREPLSPRATIAQLTLQLRASRQEAAAAEVEEAGVDQDAALAQQRERLAAPIDERRRSLEEALIQARAEAAVAAAHREASTVAGGESLPVGVSRAGLDETVPAVSEALPPINLVIDAEAFARVLATVLGEYLAASGVGTHSTAPSPASAPAKRSFWAQARHLDVFLAGVATLIVLVILAAWIG